MKRSSLAVFLIVGAVLFCLAGRAEAILLGISQGPLTSSTIAFKLTLDFTDAQPPSLDDVEAVRISLAGGVPSWAGRASFAPALEWDMIAPFGAGLDPETVDLFWGFANPTSGLQPGNTSELGVLMLSLSGLGGQSVVVRFDGGSDPDVDMTQVAGLDANGDVVQLAPGFSDAEFSFVVPAGVVPEPTTVGLGLLSLAALAWTTRGRRTR